MFGSKGALPDDENSYGQYHSTKPLEVLAMDFTRAAGTSVRWSRGCVSADRCIHKVHRSSSNQGPESCYCGKNPHSGVVDGVWSTPETTPRPGQVL